MDGIRWRLDDHRKAPYSGRFMIKSSTVLANHGSTSVEVSHMVLGLLLRVEASRADWQDIPSWMARLPWTLFVC